MMLLQYLQIMNYLNTLILIFSASTLNTQSVKIYKSQLKCVGAASRPV